MNHQIAEAYREARTTYPDGSARHPLDPCPAREALHEARRRLWWAATDKPDLSEVGHREDPYQDSYLHASTFTLTHHTIPDALTVRIVVSYDDCAEGVRDHLDNMGIDYCEVDRYEEREGRPSHHAARINMTGRNGRNGPDLWVNPDPSDWTPPAGMSRGVRADYRRERAAMAADSLARHFSDVVDETISYYVVQVEILWRDEEIADTIGCGMIEGTGAEAAAFSWLTDCDGLNEIKHACKGWRDTVAASIAARRAALDAEAAALAAL